MFFYTPSKSVVFGAGPFKVHNGLVISSSRVGRHCRRQAVGYISEQGGVMSGSRTANDNMRDEQPKHMFLSKHQPLEKLPTSRVYSLTRTTAFT